MRKKVAKRKRREVLRRGATITFEKWQSDGCGRWYDIHAENNGWNICSSGRDELEAINGLLSCLNVSETERPKKAEDEP